MDGGRITKLFRNRTARIVLLLLAALILLFAAWKVFGGSAGTASSYAPTAREERLCRVLEKIEGVNGATVMIAEEEGAPVSAIVVFEGADSILTRSRILSITAAALGIEKKNVQVYPADR